MLQVPRPVAAVPTTGRWWHVHGYRFVRYEAFGNGSLYACRCGIVRPGL